MANCIFFFWKLLMFGSFWKRENKWFRICQPISFTIPLNWTVYSKYLTKFSHDENNWWPFLIYVMVERIHVETLTFCAVNKFESNTSLFNPGINKVPIIIDFIYTAFLLRNMIQTSIPSNIWLFLIKYLVCRFVQGLQHHAETGSQKGKRQNIN